jgi:hypothetical protein
MKARLIGYWALTAVVALELLVGGEWDLTRQPYVAGIIVHLGYPLYVLPILGFWKVLGGLVLLAPGLPRIKEWAYAGMVFEMTGAAASHVLRGDGPAHYAAPLVFAALAVVSWALRPPGRRLGQRDAGPAP